MSERIGRKRNYGPLPGTNRIGDDSVGDWAEVGFVVVFAVALVAVMLLRALNHV
jgi:hypothetical protein